MKEQKKVHSQMLWSRHKYIQVEEERDISKKMDLIVY